MSPWHTLFLSHSGVAALSKIWTIQGGHEIVAVVCWHVDDLLVVGPKAKREVFLSFVKSTWECSEFTHSENETVQYIVDLKSLQARKAD